MTIKQLNSENWLTIDEATGFWVDWGEDGQTKPITGERWVERLLDPQLSESIPEEVRELFEVARGAACYGYFYYPMFTLASEQLLRVLEAAVEKKCSELDPSKVKAKFQAQIDFLREATVIDDNLQSVLHAGRGLRNFSSHPNRQAILSPVDALNRLGRTAWLLNELFRAAPSEAV